MRDWDDDVHDLVTANDKLTEEKRELLAEVERQRNLVDLQRRQAVIHCAKITQLDEENQRLQAELATVKGALPDAELLDVAATMLRYFGNSLGQTESGQLIHADAERLRAAAARVQEVREAQHADAR